MNYLGEMIGGVAILKVEMGCEAESGDRAKKEKGGGQRSGSIEHRILLKAVI